MHIDVVKAVMGWYFRLVHAVYIHSPQAAYVDLCIGDEPVTPELKKYFLTGIHHAFFPDDPHRDCNVVFTLFRNGWSQTECLVWPLLYQRIVNFLEWTCFTCIETLTGHHLTGLRSLGLPSSDDLDDIQQQVYVSMILVSYQLWFKRILRFVFLLELSFVQHFLLYCRRYFWFSWDS